MRRTTVTFRSTSTWALSVRLLFGVFLLASYRNVGLETGGSFTSLGSFSLAFWTNLAVLQHDTEAAFPGGLLWLAFLPGAIALAPRAEDRPPSALPYPANRILWRFF